MAGFSFAAASEQPAAKTDPGKPSTPHLDSPVPHALALLPEQRDGRSCLRGQTDELLPFLDQTSAVSRSDQDVRAVTLRPEDAPGHCWAQTDPLEHLRRPLDRPGPHTGSQSQISDSGPELRADRRAQSDDPELPGNPIVTLDDQGERPDLPDRAGADRRGQRLPSSRHPYQRGHSGAPLGLPRAPEPATLRAAALQARSQLQDGAAGQPSARQTQPPSIPGPRTTPGLLALVAPAPTPATDEQVAPALTAT